MTQRIDRASLAAAVSAYFIWGFMPLFFKQLAGVPAIEIISHRIIWAVPLLLLIMAFRKQLGECWAAMAKWASLRWLLVSALLISINWLVYVFAVNSGQILAASLGYYLNPLLNILLGTVFLKERLNRTQWTAVAIALVAVAVLAVGSLSTLWISLTLACSFGFYGLIRKLAPVGAIPGLAIETMLMFPIALGTAYIYASQQMATGWNSAVSISLLLVAGGAITAIPLLLFAIGARGMPYSIMGFIQYIGPTIQLITAVFLYNEVVSGARAISFALIWIALSLFSWDMWRLFRAQQVEPAAR
jgi:chloramphenicol-sensitive protein RarD